MKYFAIILLALVAFTASASQIPRSISNGKQLRTQKEIPVNRWVAKPETSHAVALETRGGGEDKQLATQALWASCAFHAALAVSAALKPSVIGDILMNSSGDATAWCCHLLAIVSLGSAAGTCLAIQDASHNSIRIASKAHIVTLGSACVYALWQYSQSTLDNQKCLGFIAVTGIIAGVLCKATVC